MCGGVTNKTASGKPAPRMTLWQAILEALRGGRWYDAVTRPPRETPSGETK